MKKRFIAGMLGILLLASSVPAVEVGAANAEDNPDLQLQTLLIDNGGKKCI